MFAQRLILAIVIPLMLAASSNASVFTDGEFFVDDWDMIARHKGGNATTSLAEFRVTTPVSPYQPPAINGAYRFTRQVRGTNAVSDQVLAVSHIYSPLSYDPASASGPLSQLSMSFDVFVPSTPPPGSFIKDSWHIVGVSVIQNGHVFLHQVQVDRNKWISLSFNGLTESDLFYFGPLPNSQKPQLDFSATGAPIQFGYATTSASFQATGATHAVDNWRLELQSQSGAVPEPSSFMVLAGLIIVGVIAFRRKPRRVDAQPPG